VRRRPLRSVLSGGRASEVQGSRDFLLLFARCQPPGRNGSVRVQLQAYNVFNQVNFTVLNANMQFAGPNATVQNSATAGTYTTVVAPRQIGLTVRLDF
jgi:hypothetical protein